MKYIIKYVSIDKLVKYEERESERPPERYLYTKILDTSCAWLPFRGDPKPMHFHQRCYELASHGIHSETGQYIFEYRERP